MSAASKWALAQAIPIRDKMVLMVLAAHADDAGNSAPSMAILTTEASICERSAQGAIKTLVTAGLISVTRGGGRSCTNIYHMETPQNTTNTPQKNPANDANLVIETPQITSETPQCVTNTPQDTAETPQTIPTMSQIAGFIAEPNNASPSPPLSSPPTPPLTIPTTTPPKIFPPSAPPKSLPPQAELLPTAPKSDPKGKRLDPTWNPGEAGHAYAVQLGLNPASTFTKFKNFWLAKAGANARKVDWSRTWQNWCLKEAEDRGIKPPVTDRHQLRKPSMTMGSPY
jgi:hypothetical protein